MSAAKKISDWPARTVTALATLGPLGTRLPAPGTWGSGAGLLLYCVVFAPLNNAGRWTEFLLATLALVALAVFACAVAERHLHKKDPGCVILDEVVAMPLVYVGMERAMMSAAHPWAWFLAGFLLFRLFDVVKPLGIKELQRAPGGIGVVADDLAAAGAACLSLHGLYHAVRFFQ